MLAKALDEDVQVYVGRRRYERSEQCRSYRNVGDQNRATGAAVAKRAAAPVYPRRVAPGGGLDCCLTP
ncbi:MAG: hypothetical protein AAB363_09905 [Planctomycetota bacterium]